MAHPIRAGVARQIISPPPGIYLIGYGDRTQGNVGIHDDLTATALVLDDGQMRLALVACDLLCMNEFIVDRIRAGVGSTIQPIICCSHTHSGPIVYADRRSPRRRRAYVATLVERIIQAIRQAEDSLTPVQLAWGQTTADIAINRREMQPDGQVVIGRNPQGPVDRSLNVVRLMSDEGAPLAMWVNFACHGTVLGPQNRHVSADWIGAMRARVEEATGSRVLFLQGAAGNLNPDLPAEDGDPWQAVESLGNRVAERVIALCTGDDLTPLEMENQKLELIRREVWLPLEAEATTPRPPKTYRRVLLNMAGLPPFLPWVVDPLLSRRYPWRSQIKAHSSRWHVPLRINGVRLGDLGLVTFGAETLTEIGMEIKAASPTRFTLFASVSDGCIGYLPTAEAHALGGYEVDIAPYFYRYPGRLDAHCAQIAIESALQAMQTL